MLHKSLRMTDDELTLVLLEQMQLWLLMVENAVLRREVRRLKEVDILESMADASERGTYDEK